MAEHKYSASFDKIFNYTRKIVEIIGLDVITKNFKYTWRTMGVFFVTIGGFIMCLHTIYIDIVIDGSFYYLFKTGSILGPATQGTAKIITALRHIEEFQFLYAEIKGMYLTYELKSSSYKQVLKESISFVKQLLLTTFSIISVTVSVLLIIPIFSLIFLNTRIEILPYFIPFLDYNTDLGFYITSLSQVLCVFVAGFGNFISDSWLFVFTAHVPLMKNILQCKFNELDEIVKENPRNPKKSLDGLRDVFKWHQKYIVFCSTLKETFFWVIFVQISTEFFCIATTIVCIFLSIWPPAPVFAIYLYSLILSYCLLGNIVDSSNDDITAMIYNFGWYNLTVSEQKMILIMLRKSQSTPCLSIGGVAPLSLNTGLQLTKTIYTFTMMIKEFFD